jgi:hypothetical protein
LESQRVKLLTDGYLRGWLQFKYPQKTSQLREELVLSYLEEERLTEVLNSKLLVEALFCSSLEQKSKEMIESVYSILKSLVGLKLPSITFEDKIESKPVKEMTKQEMDEWRDIVNKLNNK